MRRLVERPFARENGDMLYYLEIAGASDETKPTSGIVDGSIFVETDTGDVYFYSESGGDWVKQFSFQA